MSGTRWWRPWTWRIGGAWRLGWRGLAWLLEMPRARSNENHAAFRAMTVLRLGPGFGNRVVWGGGQLPTVTNWGLMARSRAFDDVDRHAVLLNISEQTALERADGNWAAVLPVIASGPGEHRRAGR